MPYSDQADRRRVWREAQRRRRARQLGTLPGVNPSTPQEGGLSPFEVGKLLAEEIRIIRSVMQEGEPERARVLVQLCTAALRAFESGDLAAKVERLENLFAGLDENARMRIHAV